MYEALAASSATRRSRYVSDAPPRDVSATASATVMTRVAEAPPLPRTAIVMPRVSSENYCLPPLTGKA